MRSMKSFPDLLVTRLKHQEIPGSADGVEYISQLAQIHPLEQMNNAGSGTASIQALNMTGKIVSAIITDSKTGKSTTILGMADSVRLRDGTALLMIEGNEVELSNITAVYDFERSDVSSLSNLLGQKCQGYIYDPETMDVMAVSGWVTGIIKGKYEDYALLDGVVAELHSILSGDHKKIRDEPGYLASHIGEEIEMKITDSSIGKIIPVTAELAAVSEKNGAVTVTLNRLKAPVDGIYNVVRNK